MSAQRLVIIASLVMGMVIWGANAWIYSVFHGGSFLETVLTHVPPYVLGTGFASIVLVIAYGSVVAYVVGAYERSHQRVMFLNDFLDTVRDVNQFIVSADEKTQLQSAACRILVRSELATAAWIIELDQRGRPRRLYQEGLSAESVAELRRLVDARELPPCAMRASEGRVVVIPEVRRCVDCSVCAAEGKQGAVVVPIRRGGLLGVLAVYMQPGAVADREKVQLVREVADDLAIGISAIEAAVAAYHAFNLAEEERSRITGIADAANALIIGLDDKHRVIFWNDYAERVSGWRREEIRGRDFLALIPETRREAVREVLSSIWGRSAAVTIETPLLARGGGEHIIEWHFTCTTEAESGDITGLGLDVTELRRAERALEEAHARYQLLVETMPDGLTVVDHNRRITYVNEAFCRMVGWSAEELIGRLADELYDEAGLKAFHEYLKRRFRNGVTECYETTFRTRDGRSIPVRVSAAPLRDETGEIVGAFSVISDISDLKEAQKELEKSEALFHAVFDNMIDVFVRVDTEGRVALVSPSVKDVLGYTPEEVLGRPVDDFLVLAHDEKGEIERRIYAKGEITDLELTILRKDGRPIWASVSGRLLRDQAGKVVGFDGIVRDIDERVRVREALEESETRYRTMFETTGTAMCLTEEDGTLTLINEEFTRLSGYSRAEVEGKLKFTDFLAPWEIKRMMGYHTARRQGGEAPRSYEFDFRTRSGEIRRVHITIDMMPGSTTSIALLRDITERHRAQEELIVREAELAAIYEHVPIATMLIDEECRVLKANRLAAAIPGVSAEEMVDHKVGNALRCIMALKHPRGCGYAPECEECLLRQRIEDTIVGEAPRGEVEVKLPLSLDGKEVDTVFLVSTAPLPHPDKTVILMTMLDVTEQRQLEEQFRQAQKMEAIGRLAGGVAHDFNNMLTVISGNAQLLQMKFRDQPDALTHVRQIEKAAQRSAHLTKQLLAFSRKQIMQPRTICPADVLRDLEPMLRRMIPESIELVTWTPEERWYTRLDPVQLEQAIMNLVVNALDALPEGRGKIVVETQNVLLDDNYVATHAHARPGPHVMIAVSDTGVGMDEETQKHIFEPFFTTKEEGRGTGLGLATVYGIVMQSGGSIYVYSEPGRGTTFKLYFPCALEEEEVLRMQAGDMAELPTGTETILLVEDEEGVREVMASLLETQGYTVLTAAGPDDAIALSEQYEGDIHLLITDVVMPGMDGANVAERITQQRPETQVLFVSGYTNNAIVHSGVLDEGTHFLQKPFDIASLAQKVRSVLDSGGGEVQTE